MLPFALPFPEISPELFAIDIGGFRLALRWYALAYLAGFILAYFWVRWLVQQARLWPNETGPIAVAKLEDLLTWMIIGVIIGGRLGFILFYDLQPYLSDPLAVLRIWEGGMAFHGGFLGVIVAGILFCRRHALDVWQVGDAVASSVCFGLFFGRIANFIRPELWGRPTDAAWGVIFPDPRAQDCRPLIELGEICARHPSQLYEAALEGAVLFALFLYLIFRQDALKRPGQIIAWFFIGYGTARTFVEGFRQGDLQFVTPNNPYGHILRLGTEADSMGITMGQVLSLPMIAIGIALLILRGRALT